MNLYEVCNWLTCNTQRFFRGKFHPWRMYSRSVELHNQRETDRVFRLTKPGWPSASKALICYIKNMELIWMLWGCESAPESNFHLVIKHCCSLKATHLITLYWRKALKHCSSLMAVILWCCQHSASIIQSWVLTAFVSFHLKWEKHLLSSLRHDEAF